MSAELLNRPRPAINYGRDRVNPPKGISIQELEAVAWSMRDRGVLLESYFGHRRYRINKTILRIQQLIIDQFGWPT